MIQWGLFPTRLQWAATSFRDDPVFAAQAYRLTQACPGDPQTAMLALELAALWAHDDPAAHSMVPGLPPIPKHRPQLPDDVLDHWLDWQRHLGRHSGVLIERDGFVILGSPLPVPFVYTGNRAKPTPEVAGLAQAGFLQVPNEHATAWLAHELDLQAVATQTVAVIPALTAARLPRELPEAFHLRPVTDLAGVQAYQEVTDLAYQASYGATTGNVLVNARTLLGHSNVQAWVVYEGNRPVRVITGFYAHGLVGAHAGAAVPDVRGMHFSEPLLATVATWGYALGANVLCGVAMPQAVPILTRIGATIVTDYVTYRRA